MPFEANVFEFNETLDKASKKLSGEMLDKFIRGIALLVLKGVVFKTPVLTGRARGGWQVDIGRMTSDDVNKKDTSGYATVLEGMSKLEEIKGRGVNSVVYIFNNVPYIIDLENGGSTQAPSGMMKVTLGQLRYGITSTAGITF